jgi:hypothetical protein
VAIAAMNTVHFTESDLLILSSICFPPKLFSFFVSFEKLLRD